MGTMFDHPDDNVRYAVRQRGELVAGTQVRKKSVAYPMYNVNQLTKYLGEEPGQELDVKLDFSYWNKGSTLF